MSLRRETPVSIAIHHAAAVLVMTLLSTSGAMGAPAEPQAATLPAGVAGWLASVRRIAASEAGRLQAEPVAAPAVKARCGASTVEKLAAVWLLGSGSVMLITGPREQDAGHWYNDSKSEGVAGAVSIVAAVALIRDIRKQRAACAP
jgi:hypothetical protein